LGRRWLPRRAPGRSLLCEVPGQRTCARDHPHRRLRREPQYWACTTRPRRPRVRTLLATPAPSDGQELIPGRAGHSGL